MKQFTSNELRTTWINFYKERGHADCGAVSLLSDGSTGVLFNVAGMQPLMPYLLGQKHPKGTRLANVQGCVRTNDIDSVGDRSHVTFFEMMGSWSLGDYFKEDRCKWSYELLTEVFGFDRDHLAATVFAGDENAPRDEEGASFRIASGFKKENIYYLPAEDNWWGLEYGPCGPDSEMFYIADVPDCGPDCGPGCSCGKYTELGNDVFMQYEKHKDGHLTPLKQKNVDTGWGLERILAFLNGTKDVYQTDLFVPVIRKIEEVSGRKYDDDETMTRSMRILADHLRTSVMLIGDEGRLTPSNTGAGYVLRRLIRRAVRHGRTLGLSKDDLLSIAEIFIKDVYLESYPRLSENREFILQELGKEILRFESTLENGIREFKKILDGAKKEGREKISGSDAFYLYDTFGFPLELTVEMAEEAGLKVDENGFGTAMEEQKEKARASQNFSAKLSSEQSVFDELDPSLVSEFTGYDTLNEEGEVAAIAAGNRLADELNENEEGTLVFAKTPFYATMGGQKGDTGVIKTDKGTFLVKETVKFPNGRIGHVGVVKQGTIRKGDRAALSVDEAKRSSTCRNHSATHLLQAALREVLGPDTHQQGSYQDTDRTRFDFSYSKAMTPEEIRRVEEIVNEKIEEDLPVITKVMDLEEAKKEGAMALFGEKYADRVRVVNMGDFSKELCGGTHVAHTGQILSFKILSESGIASGVRRIEAVTGRNVSEHYRKVEEKLEEAAAAAKSTPDQLAEKITSLFAQIRSLSSEIESLKAKAAKEALGNAAQDAKDIQGTAIIAKKLTGVDMNSLRDLGDQLKGNIKDGVIVLISESEGKVNMIIMATDEAVKKGAHAGNLVKGIAPIVGGGGGGKPNMAQAGGKNPAGIDEALRTAETLLMGQIAK
ncbi:MAG: alanine--tRNA ligase [Lachnospiraceae bacterium]|nr:alanine--tRNA ligase [Lachnospiraceae bacterium]